MVAAIGPSVGGTGPSAMEASPLSGPALRSSRFRIDFRVLPSTSLSRPCTFHIGMGDRNLSVLGSKEFCPA